MKSMTGYAKEQTTLKGKTINIEIKTLNSKQLDLIVKLPSSLRDADLPIRSLLAQLERGKIEVTITEDNSNMPNNGLNHANASLHLKDILDWCNCDTNINSTPNIDNLLPIVLRLNDVWGDVKTADYDANDIQILLSTVQQGIDTVQQFRQHEGDILAIDIEKHVAAIEEYLNKVPQYETERIDTAKERIHKFFADYTAATIDENRFEQELIYYLEKLDITEEKVRLKKHIDYFRQTAANDAVCGKKLGFIAQEMGREINTTGSKANHVEIQRLVVEMKDELEKIKEQLGNIL